MAQHDYVIANGTGAAVRSDLNNALAAIVSNNSGATEPTTTYAYMWWPDTSTGLLKLRNGANNAWITLRELDGTLTIEDGTASSPGLAFADDLNTGIYSPSADQLGITTGGTVRLTTTTTGITSALPVDVPLGTASAPTVTFTGDLNTGIYSPGADQVAISTNGTQRVTVDTAATTSTLPVVHPLGAVGTPSITFTGDLNTGIWSPAADTIAFSEGGVEAMRIDSSGRVGIGTTSPGSTLDVAGTVRAGGSGVSPALNPRTTSGNTAIQFTDLTNTKTGYLNYDNNNLIYYGDGAVERFRCDSSGRLLVGTSSARDNFFNLGVYTAKHLVEGTGGTGAGRGSLAIVNNSTTATDPGYLIFGRTKGSTVGSNTALAADDWVGMISFQGSDGTEFVECAQINAYVDGTPGANDMPGRLVFSTTADGASSPTERLRIANNGNMMLGGTTQRNSARFTIDANGTHAPFSLYVPSTGSYTNVFFENPNGNVGSIVTNGSATAYNTSSDYRLKENVVAVTDGIARLQQLKPSRFNFIADPDTTVDGFIAHEVQEVIPEAITGEKDAVDEDGNPVYQGIDQSKLVPLLTAALQEAITKIETLEAKVAALETP